jgi:hypothetical protein
LFDDINDFDCTQASHLEAALATAGFKWSEVHGLSDEDPNPPGVQDLASVCQE